MLLNSHDKVTYNLMLQKGRDMSSFLEKQTCYCHDKAVLHPKRHQTAPQSRKAWHMLVMILYQHQSSTSAAHTERETRRLQLHQCSDPCRTPLKISTFIISPLPAAARGRTGDRLPLTSPSPLSQQHFSISPCVGLLGVLGNVRMGRESCSEERSPEDQEESVTIPSNTLAQKPLRKGCLLHSFSSLPTSQQILVT